MRYPASETAEKHERILDEASRLFRERSLADVSVHELMKAAALTHGSFYNHFGSKTDLVNETVEHVRHRAVDRIGSFEKSSQGKIDFYSSYLSTASRDTAGSACLMPSLAAELGREEAYRPAFTNYVKSFVDKIASHFPKVRRKDARSDAIRATSAMVGAMVLARAVDDEALSQEILSEIIAMLSEQA